jgi:hypothetical protein
MFDRSSRSHYLSRKPDLMTHQAKMGVFDLPQCYGNFMCVNAKLIALTVTATASGINKPFIPVKPATSALVRSTSFWIRSTVFSKLSTLPLISV